jgi:hypothetical protein
MEAQAQEAAPAKEAEPCLGIFELLRKRHEGQAWAYLEEVRNGTGFGRTVRTADALAMSLFPSRGLHLHGFEIKVSRADWIKERDQPEKAEEIARFCHYWWLAVSDGAIVKDGELPQPWGLLVAKGGKLVVKKQAVFNEAALAPTHVFLAAVMRKFAKNEGVVSLLEKARQEGSHKGWQEGRDWALSQTTAARDEKRLAELQARLDEFEKKSGIRIDAWSKGNIASAVRVLTSGYGSPIQKLARLAEDADAISKAAREAAVQAGVVAHREEEDA